MKWSVILGQYISSKSVVDKIKVPSQLYNQMNQGINEIESWASIFSDLELDKPQTWVSTSMSLMRKISKPKQEERGPSKFQIIKSKLSERQMWMVSEYKNWKALLPIYRMVIKNLYPDVKKVLKLENGSIKVVRFDDQSSDFYFYEENNEGDFSERETLPFFLHPRHDDFDKFNERMAQAFWKDRDIVQLHIERNSLEFEEFDAPDRKYEGVLSSLGDCFEKYKEKGIRRSVLFQGEPGTGKSTLAFNIADQISKRTVVLTHSFIHNIHEQLWKILMSLIRPDMIIVDDIDRISHVMENHLSLFEDHYCDVPLILMTSNHYMNLPDAFRRPGRIDQIIKMTSPPRDVRQMTIRSIAEQEYINPDTVPEEKMDVLDSIFQKYPGAYIVEMFRRIKVHGWNCQIQEYDATFPSMEDGLKDEWNSTKVKDDSVVTIRDRSLRFDPFDATKKLDDETE